MGKFFFFIAVVLFAEVLPAQEPIDALRYGMIGQGGTARAQAIGGAIVSLGGDISTATVNPAGLGLFKTNDFVFSPGISFGNTKIDYLGQQKKDKNFNADFSNIGIVLAKPGYQTDKWRNFTFAIGMNKMVNYSNKTLLEGSNNKSSYSEKYIDELINNQVTDPNRAANDYPYGSSLAFNTYLIDTIAGPGNSVLGYRSLATPLTGVTQRQSSITKGGIRDTYFAGSANFQDKLFLGATIVFSKLRFERTNTFRETDASGNDQNNFNYFETEEYLLSEGVGLGLKLGALYKATDFLRIGLAFHSPVAYNMTDRYSTLVTTDLEGYLGNGVMAQSSLNLNSSELGQFQYNYVNPMRMMLGASYVLHSGEDVTKQKGFLSADVEYINYASSKFKTYTGEGGSSANGDSYLKQVTATVKDQFKSALNFRVGGELKFNTIMTRLGFNYMGNPYNTPYVHAKKMNISGGLGYRNRGVFIDLTYIQQITQDATFPYKLDTGFYEPGFIKQKMGNVIMTVGFKF